MKHDVAPSSAVSGNRTTVDGLNTPGPGHSAGTKDLAEPGHPRIPHVYHRGDGQRRRDLRTAMVPEYNVDLSWERRDPNVPLWERVAWRVTERAMKVFSVAVAVAIAVLLVFNAYRGMLHHAG